MDNGICTRTAACSQCKWTNKRRVMILHFGGQASSIHYCSGKKHNRPCFSKCSQFPVTNSSESEIKHYVAKFPLILENFEVLI